MPLDGTRPPMPLDGTRPPKPVIKPVIMDGTRPPMPEPMPEPKPVIADGMAPPPPPEPVIADGTAPPPPPTPEPGPAVGHCGTGGANPNCDGKDSKEACEGASTQAGQCIWTGGVAA